MSAVAWLTSNYYSSAALDPPREDINIVSVFQEKPEKVRQKPPANDLESALQDVVRQEIFLSEALGDLVTSFERSMKIDSLKRSRKKSEGLIRHEVAQIEAIRLNGTACIYL
jgi:hypothetical protein